MKTCVQCREEYPLDQFYAQKQRGKNGQVWDYRDSYCKPCRSDYSMNRKRDRKRQAVDYLGGECKDCGLRTECVEVYDFHHLDPTQKDFSISKSSKTFESIKSELGKCVLLCANCHRVRHASRPF